MSLALLNMLAIWLMQRVWVELELTLLHFGWIWCLLQLIGGATGQLAHGAERWFGAKPVILLNALLVLAGLCLMGGWKTVLGYCRQRAAFCGSRSFQRAVYGRFESTHRGRLSGHQ